MRESNRRKRSNLCVVEKMLIKSGNIGSEKRDKETEKKKKSGRESGGSRPLITCVVTSNHKPVG